MYGFDPMQDADPIFRVIETVGPILIALVAIAIGIVLVKGILQWFRNNGSPVLSVKARVVNLRMKVSGGMHTAGDNLSASGASTYYYATFEAESGDRMEFAVGDEEYGLLAQGDTGSLTYQGTRYLGFQRH
jgi:hypothetical protein